MSVQLNQRKQEIETEIAIIERNIRLFNDRLVALNREYLFISGKLEGLEENKIIIKKENAKTK